MRKTNKILALLIVFSMLLSFNVVFADNSSVIKSEAAKSLCKENSELNVNINVTNVPDEIYEFSFAVTPLSEIATIESASINGEVITPSVTGEEPNEVYTYKKTFETPATSLLCVVKLNIGKIKEDAGEINEDVLKLVTEGTYIKIDDVGTTADVNVICDEVSVNIERTPSSATLVLPSEIYSIKDLKITYTQGSEVIEPKLILLKDNKTISIELPEETTITAGVTYTVNPELKGFFQKGDAVTFSLENATDPIEFTINDFYAGDFDDDEDITIYDLNILSSELSKGLEIMDINKDEVHDKKDLIALGDYWRAYYNIVNTVYEEKEDK